MSKVEENQLANWNNNCKKNAPKFIWCAWESEMWAIIFDSEIISKEEKITLLISKVTKLSSTQK